MRANRSTIQAFGTSVRSAGLSLARACTPFDTRVITGPSGTLVSLVRITAERVFISAIDVAELRKAASRELTDGADKAHASRAVE